MLVLVSATANGALPMMDAEDFRAIADRCRELARVAARDDVREQLRQWEREFEWEAEAVENSDTRLTRAGPRTR
jgi:hypothetical protein